MIEKLFLLILLSGIVCYVNGLDERSIQVSDLPVSRFVPPNCNYTVRKGDRTGEVVKGSVSVGDPLYHGWQCSSTGGIYCIMVHSCTLGNSSQTRGKQVEIVDEFGCTIFPELLPNMKYTGDTEAGFRVNAFLIDIDQMSLFFKCSLKFLVKIDGHCRRPLCPPR